MKMLKLNEVKYLQYSLRLFTNVTTLSLFWVNMRILVPQPFEVKVTTGLVLANETRVE